MRGVVDRVMHSWKGIFSFSAATAGSRPCKNKFISTSSAFQKVSASDLIAIAIQLTLYVFTVHMSNRS